MFFSDDLLTTKKGSFGIVWLAATLGPRSKRISRKDLINVDLSRTCELIAEPPEPMALRLSGSLLVGVARVYNQNYEMFYADVNHFHTALRRSIASDFAPVSGSASGIAAGVDMLGDGKSRFDRITFTGYDVTLQTGLDLGLGFINWRDPFGKRKRRRASTKLDSLPSQQTNDGDSEDDGTNSEYSEDGSELPIGREKSPKVPSSLLFGNIRDTTRRITSVYHRGDRLESLDRDFAFPSDQPIDLGLFDNAGDMSISAPSGRGFELAETPYDNSDFADLFIGSVFPAVEPAMHTAAPLSLLDKRPAKSRLKSGRGAQGSQESLSDVDEVLEKGLRKNRRIRKKKFVTFDPTLEVEDDRAGSQFYASSMTEQKRFHLEKEESRLAASRATQLVDSAGGWADFLDPELQSYFATITKPGPFKWELDVAAHRSGEKWNNQQDVGQQVEAQPVVEQPHGDDAIQLDSARGLHQRLPARADKSSQEIVDTYQQVEGQGGGRGSIVGEVEILRRDRQYNHQNGLPWQDIASNVPGSDIDIFDAGGPDSSFTPGSLKFSLMTPQELKLRSSSRQGSFSGGFSSIGLAYRRSRSRSGSLLGRTDQQPQLLIGDNELELPILDYDIETSASQAGNEVLVPEAFKPEMLATLESQCRDFLSYLEHSLLAGAKDTVKLDDLVSFSATKRVGAAAFYNCLTLATKRLVNISQVDHWGPINIGLSA